MSTFRKSLMDIINHHNLDEELKTPDWVLADYIERCLQGYKIARDNHDSIIQDRLMISNRRLETAIQRLNQMLDSELKPEDLG